MQTLGFKCTMPSLMITRLLFLPVFTLCKGMAFTLYGHGCRLDLRHLGVNVYSHIPMHDRLSPRAQHLVMQRKYSGENFSGSSEPHNLCCCNNAHCLGEGLQLSHKQFEPRYEKTDLRGFRPGPTQTGLCNYTRWLEA